MERHVKFKDNNGLIDSIYSSGYKELTSQVIDFANTLVACGLDNLKFSVKRYKPEYIFDKRDENAEILRFRFQIPGVYDTTFRVSSERYESPESIDHLNHNEKCGYSQDRRPADFVRSMTWDIQRKIVAAYGNKHTPDKKRPKLRFIQLEDDPFYFVSTIQRDVRENTDGYDINVINEADYIAPFTLADRFLIALRIKHPPVLALPAPEKKLPDAISTLPDRFGEKLAKMKDGDLKTKAITALENINKAISILDHKDEEQAEEVPSENENRIFDAFNYQAKRDLRTDLFTISIALDEFDFGKSSDKLNDYLDLVNSVLVGRFENVLKRNEIQSDSIEQIGMDVSLHQMRRRLQSVERLAIGL